MPETTTVVALHEATRTRYLSYALSVITSRALPDVRDGLKPVQRRILYAMFAEMGLHPAARYRKCAAVVGEVMGKFHPHGDSSIYEALVRMAQDFSLRAPLVDGHGNFGSLDGDPPAAMRYTEAKLRPIAEELLLEIKKRTVDWRPTYDGQHSEPIVLPAQFPQLLVNGCEGIAVGMATRVPPHALGEVVDATVALIDDPAIDIAGLMRHLPGPDFPTGGRILSSVDEIREIYETGQGTLRVCATWREEKDGRNRLVVLDDVPYGQNKAKLLERIGEEVRLKRLPQLTDVRDESTDIVRIVLELKQGASAEEVMAYLFKRTPLQTTWPVNLTALVPSADGSSVLLPARLNLKEILNHFVDFRVETVRRRYEYDLAELRERIHILEGFARIFDLLDEAIRIIRASEGRRDATEQLMDRFGLTEVQTDAILELRLYRLARLEIQLILEELAEKQAEAEAIERILSSERELLARVRSELAELRALYADARRTVLGAPEHELTFDEDAYVVREDTFVVVTRDGWIKRQSSFTELSKIRVRDGDEIGWLLKVSTASTLAFYGSGGGVYVLRVDGIPATTGYGDPLTRHFALSDGERVVGVISQDRRHLLAPLPQPVGEDGEAPPAGPYAVALTQHGRILRFSLVSHAEATTRNGRRYGRVDEGDAVFAVYPTAGAEWVSVATRLGNAMAFPVSEVPILRAPGKGVTGIKLRDDDQVLAFVLASTDDDGAQVVTSFGREVAVTARAFPDGGRGLRGRALLKRGTIDLWRRPGPVIALGDKTPSTPPLASESVE
jgi:DNA gyrase subunit A